ncbi:uncharacterized protein RHIMIDRAFT_277214 [Rhizopus microsporus ATCC 52813]|uniref:P-loop containing nucleoside triphosphate hydrolase protein n=1 Tax=Rhizopus microsporus ATCC 52813 TaxID=1340429 RepID=A0A2G4SEU3_RHIZD|nr:uncharacterized protein RHIMIDRAFT_277214 [Rhizopus microsporus ATCC 52813]PHZ07300.1 hypothetical protein RHIMIDRAFT_277214 [Rhizopus microsporus ATCC 52813]
MVNTRSSSRIVNKAKAEQSRVTRRKMLTEELVSDNDFQDPIIGPTESTMALRRSPRKRLRTSTSSTSLSSTSTSVSAASPRKTRSRQTSVIIESQAHKQESDEEESDEEEINPSTAASFDSDEEETIDSGIVTASEQPSDSVADSLEPESEYEFARLESQDEQYQLEETQEPETEFSQSAQTSSSSSDEEEEEQLAATRRRRFVRRQRDPVYERSRNHVLKHHPELKTVWDDLKNTEKAHIEPIEQPKELSLPLLPFQKYGVGWMIQQESVNTDEMGMGKTIQTISLLLSDKKKPSLVVAPTVAVMQWKREIETHTNNALSVHLFHGSKRTNKVEDLQKYDVVLSTYSVVESCFRRQEYGVKRMVRGKPALVKEKSVLHKVDWHRIILDEAHNIKDRACNTARAVFNLKANYRWSLTGTPLQNRVGELYSLIRFMQADPYAYYYCMNCPCKQINWKFSNKKECDECGHRPMNHMCWWNNEVLKPIQSNGYIGDGRIAMEKLGLLLDRVMLRRTKVECADDLGLPPRTVMVRRDIFSEEEEDIYRSLYSDVSRQFATYVEHDTVLNNYANIFELLTKMRQCADHPDLVTKKASDAQQLVCMLCNDPPEDAISAACKHVFCRECCIQYYSSFDDSEGEVPKCPSCFANFSVDLSQEPIQLEGSSGTNGNYSRTSIVNRINMDKWRSSTKIEALVEELSKLRREDKTIKSIFVNFLDLVYWRLSRAGFECIRLDGTMSPAQRDAAIHHFMTKPTCTVFLISLKAGGVALNLTEASRVFICDPWWNPAMDRIHRLGQRRPIRITRLIIENSIESRIVQLQEKKTALVESTVGKNSKALDRLSVEDLRFLFVM